MQPRKRPSNPPSIASGSSSRAPSPAPQTSGIDTAVTKLLVSTKTLLEALTQWSLGATSDDHISDIYVQLGNNFNSVCSVFAREHISMNGYYHRDLLSVPDDLRTCLETCLSSDEATPATLEIHLPQIKNIIVRLLQGLKAKQAQHKAILHEKRQQAAPPLPAMPPPIVSHAPNATLSSMHKKGSSVSSNGSIASTEIPRSSAASTSKPPQQDPRTDASTSTSVQRNKSVPSRTKQPTPPPSTMPKSKSTSLNNLASASSSNASISSPPAVSVQLPSESQTEILNMNQDPIKVPIIKVPPSKSSMSQTASFESLRNQDNLVRRASKRFSRYTLDKMTNGASPSKSTLADVDSPSRRYPKQPPPLPQPHQKPSSSSPTIQKAPLPLPPTIAKHDSWNMHVAELERRENSLAEFEQLARRPSDSWNQHLLELERDPTPPDAKQVLSQSAPVSTNSDAPPSAPQAQRAPTPSNIPGRLETVEELPSPDISIHMPVQSPQPPPSAASLFIPAAPEPSPASTRAMSQLISPSHAPPDTLVNPTENGIPSYDTDDKVPQEPESVTIYISLGRETKKTNLDPDQFPPTIASLRYVFMDRFGYNPGLQDFPSIYIRDPRLGVEYELEDLTEVKDGCVLRLNIEPLDQVKQHIDSGLLTLSKDIKDLKTSIISAVKRASIPPVPPLPASFSTELAPIATSPIVRRQSNPPVLSSTNLPTSAQKVDVNMAPYFEEIQNVRRDLAVLKQIYAESTGQHKQVVSNLRTQVEKVKAIANTQPAASRAFIDAGKKKLDTRSQDLLTKVETLMDTVESMRDDVTIRRARPHISRLQQIRKEIEDAQTEMQDLRTYINTVRPSWKKTWSQELQNVVEEERFLKHQEEMLHELGEDHCDLADMFEIIDELAKKQQGPSRAGSRSGLKEYVPPEPDTSHEGLSSVMTEVKSLSVDPEKRLKAIAQAEKNRDKELADRKANDDFANELGGFVENKMLKKTGGTEEADRIRKLKSEATLKQMFQQAQETHLPESPNLDIKSDTASRPSSSVTMSSPT